MTSGNAKFTLSSSTAIRSSFEGADIGYVISSADGFVEFGRGDIRDGVLTRNEVTASGRWKRLSRGWRRHIRRAKAQKRGWNPFTLQQ